MEAHQFIGGRMSLHDTEKHKTEANHRRYRTQEETNPPNRTNQPKPFTFVGKQTLQTAHAPRE
jgi:hypothetical protein